LGNQQISSKPPVNHRYNQNHFGVSNVTGVFLPTYDPSGANSNSSTIHLPPLLTHNANKYVEKQRRTQLLQKQRLKKEYFN
jgi:hypothetical protein